MADPEYMAHLARIRAEQEECKAKKQRCKEEKDRENELRRAQMTPEERAADIEDEKRRQAIRRRFKAIEGLDIVAMALSGEYLNPNLQAAVLGQTPYTPDQTAFLRSLNGYKEEMGDIHAFQRRVYKIRDLDLWWCSAELCKFALCDWRIPRYAKDYNNTGLEDMYQKQLGRERKNDRREQARALVREINLKRAQYWARKMLTEFEAAAGRGEQLDALKAWAGMRISKPSWIQEIMESDEEYGFVIYKSHEIENRPAVAEGRWLEVWDGSGDLDSDLFKSYIAACGSVYGGWSLNTHELNYDSECGPRPNKLLPTELPTFFLWAYDPDWKPPIPPGDTTKYEPAIEACACRGTFVGGHGGADEDGYQGRVKVAIRDLYGWFYYARSTGVDLKDLWRKAQVSLNGWHNGHEWEEGRCELFEARRTTVERLV
ncbi:hypothetical protein G7Z17_g4261 [Cylindrodendrum hubeiense]|uniref:Uncharacterized protein n=1 Tax=Cylindrodendrum hubeiense TaxID=595255 RepID=A0A9P5H946_9HYPO|nr:hypothetical protein G7Z17_g4261 [Cylindrodendrum hubeiense]